MLAPRQFRMRDDWEHDFRRVELINQFVCRFPNGYGVSVVQGYGTYGAEDGLFEVAVTVYTDSNRIHDFRLTYDTPITDNVIGHQTVDQVADIMEKVASLPPTPWAANMLDQGV